MLAKRWIQDRFSALSNNEPVPDIMNIFKKNHKTS